MSVGPTCQACGSHSENCRNVRVSHPLTCPVFGPFVTGKRRPDFPGAPQLVEPRMKASPFRRAVEASRRSYPTSASEE
jgi:hypothetical protein